MSPEQAISDIRFLLSFVPASSPEDVEEGLFPTAYVTGNYTGDVELAARVAEIMERYQLTEDSLDV